MGPPEMRSPTSLATGGAKNSQSSFNRHETINAPIPTQAAHQRARLSQVGQVRNGIVCPGYRLRARARPEEPLGPCDRLWNSSVAEPARCVSRGKR
jgi:hypothetical protein